jgi:small subunit ribosomal protein S1
MAPFAPEPSDQEESDEFAQLLASSETETLQLHPGQALEATVVKLTTEWVFLDTGRKGEGVLDRKELLAEDGSLPVAEGDRLKVFFLGMDSGEMRFTTRLGKGGGAPAQFEEAWRSAVPVEGVVEKEIKGGFEVKLAGSTRAFCPYSQFDLHRVVDASVLLGKPFSFRITQFSENGRNLVVSRRVLLEEEAQQRAAALRETLRVGMVVRGTITSLRDFGAFIDIGGIEGLIPISEIAWGRIEHPSDLLSVGASVEVTVKSLDWEQKRFSFSLRDTLADPWSQTTERFPVGSYHTGKVSRLAPFGAFVALGEGVDGLLHISKLGAGRRLSHPREVLKEGETVEVQIEGVDREQRRISLGLAEVTRQATEEANSIASFRQQAEQQGSKSMGTLGDLLRAKLDKGGR